MKRLFYIWFLLTVALTAAAQQDVLPEALSVMPAKQPLRWPKDYADSAIWQGFNIKVDLGNTVYQIARTKARTQQYEMAFNVNLLKRFYPTIEGGYGFSSDEAEGGAYHGQGGFFRVGLDLNPLRKGRNSEYALLVGVRLGCGMQNYTLTGVTLNDSYWNPEGTTVDFPKTFRADCWGEIVAGLQIKVVGPFTMGWYARIHSLFTSKRGDHQPYYIPGYGCTAASIFGFNYYLGLRF